METHCIRITGAAVANARVAGRQPAAGPTAASLAGIRPAESRLKTGHAPGYRQSSNAGMIGSMIRRLFAFPLFATLLLGLHTGAHAANGGPPDFTRIVQDNRSAVVNIATTQQVEQRMPGVPEEFLERLPEGSPFRDFFRRFERGGPGQQPRERNSLGSGFIIESDGYILTNAHVVAEADEILVKLDDNREFEAEVIGVDRPSDVGLLKIEAEGLPTVEFGDSDNLEVGEWVLAIGSPFGLDYTATQGIVSALNRKLPNDTYTPFIQTDVAVNPGNSGGPLFNRNGRVIGINAQIFSRTGGFMGLSFAVPINIARDVADQLRESGTVQRGFLGVTIQSIDRDLAQSFGLERPIGALVADVRPDSPAEEAGITSGDVIVEFNGREVTDSASLPPMVGQTRPGSEADIVLIRNGERRTVEVEIGELERDDQSARSQRSEGEDDASGALNLAVRQLTDSERADLGLDDRGLLVQRVAAGAAARAGIRPGDILLRMGRRELRTVDDLRAAIDETARGEPVALQIRRGDRTLFVSLILPAEE